MTSRLEARGDPGNTLNHTVSGGGTTAVSRLMETGSTRCGDDNFPAKTLGALVASLAMSGAWRRIVLAAMILDMASAVQLPRPLLAPPLDWVRELTMIQAESGIGHDAQHTLDEPPLTFQ